MSTFLRETFGNIVVTMGTGNVTELAPQLLADLGA